MPRRLLLLLAALAVFVSTGAASALTAASAQNRVRAFQPEETSLVGLTSSESPCLRPGSVAGIAGVAAGFCVATEDEAGALYRADSRGPDEIFKTGFEPKGNNMDLWAHVTENPADSGYVSTTSSLQAAQDFADENGLDYIYRVQANGVDVNATFGEDSPFPWEHEVAVPGSIPPSAIELSH